jgi:hypothetical protein
LNGWVGTGLTFISGWCAGGYYHSRSIRKQLGIKFKKEQKELYQQYYNDVYALQKQNNELIVALEDYIANNNNRQAPPAASQKQQSLKKK